MVQVRSLSLSRSTNPLSLSRSFSLSLSLGTAGSACVLLRCSAKHCCRARSLSQSESACENLSFWLAVEDFKKLDETDPTRWNDAAKLVSEFINVDAPRQVNISGKARAVVEKAFEEKKIEQTTFDQAQKTIFGLIKRDNFPRYVNSDEFSAMLAQVGAYNNISIMKA